MKNPFYILNVSPKSTKEEIKKAYHNLAKIYHPDVFSGDKESAQEKMQELNWAYNLLQDSIEFEYYSDLYYKDQNPNTENTSTKTTNSSNREYQKAEQQTNNNPKKKTFFKFALVLVSIVATISIFVIPNIVNRSHYKTENINQSSYSTTSQVAKAQKSSVTVYVTDTGTKYHRSSCGSLYQSKKAINLTDAVAAGYKPCNKCNPKRLVH